MQKSVKKIVYVHRSFFPGPKAHHAATAKMLDAFSKRTDTVLVLRKYRKKFTDSIKDYFALERDLDIQTPFSLGFLPFRLDFVYDRSLDRKLCEVSEAFPDGESVVYYRYSGVTGKSMAAHSRRHKMPFFCEVHTPVKSRKEVENLKEMKGIVVITEWLRNHLADMGIDSEKILVAPSGVDISLYDKKRQCSKEQIRKKLSLPSNVNLVVYTGKPYEGRGAETLIESSAFLGDSALVLIVGGLPEDLKRLNAIVERKGLQGKVKLEGHKPLHQIPLYQLSADVLTMPYSKDWNLQRSASPVKMFEYMASGNPIVSSDFPNIREVLSEENSVLVPPDNPRLLAEGITKCLQDRFFADSITANARERVNAFGWDGRAVKVTDFMSSFL